MVRDGLGEDADFSYWQCYEGPAIGSPDGPIAQLDRVTDFYSVGCRFESCWDRQSFQYDKNFVRRKPPCTVPKCVKPFDIRLSRSVPVSLWYTDGTWAFQFLFF
jgi:hypothetical protein